MGETKNSPQSLYDQEVFCDANSQPRSDLDFNRELGSLEPLINKFMTGIGTHTLRNSQTFLKNVQQAYQKKCCSSLIHAEDGQLEGAAATAATFSGQQIAQQGANAKYGNDRQ